MIQIRKSILDCRSETVATGTLPMRFDNRAAAIAFLEWYLTAVFAEGRSGYQSDGGYWWGCDASDEPYLHCYNVADEPPPAARVRPPRRRRVRHNGIGHGDRYPGAASG